MHAGETGSRLARVIPVAYAKLMGLSCTTVCTRSRRTLIGGQSVYHWYASVSICCRGFAGGQEGAADGAGTGFESKFFGSVSFRDAFDASIRFV